MTAMPMEALETVWALAFGADTVSEVQVSYYAALRWV
jgi:hypothetical protein